MVDKQKKKIMLVNFFQFRINTTPTPTLSYLKKKIKVEENHETKSSTNHVWPDFVEVDCGGSELVYGVEEDD